MLMFVGIKRYFKNYMKANVLNPPSKVFSYYPPILHFPNLPFHSPPGPDCLLIAPHLCTHLSSLSFPPLPLFPSFSFSLSLKSVPELPPPGSLSYPLPYGLGWLIRKRGMIIGIS